MSKVVNEWLTPAVVLALVGMGMTVFGSYVAAGRAAATADAETKADIRQLKHDVEQMKPDHDTLTRLDERVAWLCRTMGKKE